MGSRSALFVRKKSRQEDKLFNELAKPQSDIENIARNSISKALNLCAGKVHVLLPFPTSKKRRVGVCTCRETI